MKMIAHAARLSALLLTASCLTLTACGQDGKGNKNPETQQPPANPFAGKTMAMKQEAYTFNLGMQEAIYAFQNDLVPEYALIMVNDYTYDQLGRFAREVITTFPTSPVSNIPPGGFLTYDMQFTYSSSQPWEEELGVQQMWHGWWDGGSLARDRTTTWSGDMEELSVYDPITLEIRTVTLDIKEQVNAQGYVTAAMRHELGNPNPIPYRTEIYYRDTSGTRLDKVELSGATIDYRYYPNGALQSMEIVDSASGSRTLNTYHYSTNSGFYFIAVEERSFDASGGQVGLRTALEVYASGFCHEATRRRVTFERPNWSVCRELSNWQ